ncbi:ABC transporter ATP-binding protein [Bifidobacterium dentium]|uniref:ATP-binding cassette domain-containing protein n=1 Tax=Bifidobacterium dentium TaxID=1689 RepID=UPI0018B0EEA9|nr:ATP-binding cassette domain-containing protein [Bifidobacterium dentium]MBF9668198.1 ABC transporter ATP-binding protein [Bifidobacterium dentium]
MIGNNESMPDASESLLDAQNITVSFNIGQGKDKRVLYALNNVSMMIAPGEIHGLVGESGSGKSTFARVVCGLQPIQSGNIVFGNVTLGSKRTLTDRKNIQMVFQDPYASLDPRMTVKAMISEVLLRHHIVTRSECERKCRELLGMVQLSESFLNARPGDMSGGQRQRVVIARALAVNPKLLIADEAVASLDVSVQAGIINLLMDLRERHNIAILFIAHNLAVVRSLCDRISVIYLGRIVEEASRDELYGNPIHPYTRRLLKAVPRLDGQHTKLAPNESEQGIIHLPDGTQGRILSPDPMVADTQWTLLSLDDRRDHYVAATRGDSENQ